MISLTWIPGGFRIERITRNPAENPRVSGCTLMVSSMNISDEDLLRLFTQIHPVIVDRWPEIARVAHEKVLAARAALQENLRVHE